MHKAVKNMTKIVKKGQNCSSSDCVSDLYAKIEHITDEGEHEGGDGEL